jgi:two-component system chemotaxis response regulator CheY
MTLRALVVDDSLQLRRSVMFALQRLEGVVCVEAADGAEALKKFQASSFDIVLTDINMPLMDGLKLTAHIRSGKRNSEVPIVIISTESAESDRARALTLGADAYLVKPVQAQEVLRTVKALLGR